MNEYSVEADLDAGTEWVLTFPTKNFYADSYRMEAAGLPYEECETIGEGEDEVTNFALTFHAHRLPLCSAKRTMTATRYVKLCLW